MLCGIVQLAGMFGLYPKGLRFESSYRSIWPVGQEVKTRPFHGCNASSILARVTNKTG